MSSSPNAKVAILGADQIAIDLGLRLVIADWPILGIWARSHSDALVAALHLGCCAFPHPAEILSAADVVLVCLSPAEREWFASHRTLIQGLAVFLSPDWVDLAAPPLAALVPGQETLLTTLVEALGGPQVWVG